MTANEFVSRLGAAAKARPEGSGWKVCCPGHKDKTPSLHVSKGDDGRVLLTCFAGCSAERICEGAGIKLSDLFNDQKPHRNGNLPAKLPKGSAGRIVATYNYTDETGNLLFQAVRFDPKDFRQRKPDGNGGWIDNIKDVRRVPYRLPEVIKAVAEKRTVFITDGEKDADALVEIGFVATCKPMGGNKWPGDFTQYFQGADVCVIADKDEPGRAYAQDVASKLTTIVASIRVLELPGDGVKDAHDWIAAGGEAVELDELWHAAPLFVKGQNDPQQSTGQTDPCFTVKRLCDLQPRIKDDPSELLRTGFLCRGGALLLCGPTGVGKSSLAMQFMIGWAVGHAVFGIEPTRPLKSLLVQAENDEGDIHEMKSGVLAGLQLQPNDRAYAEQHVLVIQEDKRTSRAFVDEVVAPLLAEHKPDLLWIDPALAYIGGAVGQQEVVTPFLRNMLNPLIHQSQCGLIVVHHTNKPPTGKEKSSWSGSDMAYLGAGSAEWANWARAVLSMRSLGAHDVYELHAGKRGARLGWRNEDGSRSFKREIAHWKEPGVICWREAEEGECSKIGRPKSNDADELLALLPGAGLSTSEWLVKAESECGVTRRTFFRLKKTLARDERISKSTTSDHWQPVTKRP